MRDNTSIVEVEARAKAKDTFVENGESKLNDQTWKRRRKEPGIQEGDDEEDEGR